MSAVHCVPAEDSQSWSKFWAPHEVRPLYANNEALTDAYRVTPLSIQRIFGPTISSAPEMKALFAPLAISFTAGQAESDSAAWMRAVSAAVCASLGLDTAEDRMHAVLVGVAGRAGLLTFCFEYGSTSSLSPAARESQSAMVWVTGTPPSVAPPAADPALPDEPPGAEEPPLPDEPPAAPALADEPALLDEPPAKDEPPLPDEPPRDEEPPLPDEPPLEAEPPLLDEPPLEVEPPLLDETPPADPALLLEPPALPPDGLPPDEPPVLDEAPPAELAPPLAAEPPDDLTPPFAAVLLWLLVPPVA